METARVRTCLWFAADGEHAAEFYVGLLPDSRIETVLKPDPDAPVQIVDFRLAGTPYTILNGGPMFRPTPAASISVLTQDQAETDRLWDLLTADGGAPGQCGWLTDRWGVSWQIVPEILPKLLVQTDRLAAARVQAAMMEMTRIDIKAIERAAASD